MYVRLASGKLPDTHNVTIYVYDPKTGIGREVIGELTTKDKIIVHGKYLRGSEQTPNDLSHFSTPGGSGFTGRIRTIDHHTGRRLFTSWFQQVENKRIEIINSS